MKILSDWGFSSQSWQGHRGEYWVLVQALLIIGFTLLPTYRPAAFSTPSTPVMYGLWVGAAMLGLVASVLLLKGFLDLGRSLTPLPYPREDAQLVQSGVYRWVRHPIYGGLILAALSWATYQISLSHLAGAVILFAFFNAKANQEENWLAQKYSEYGDYQKRVKKLIPGLY